MRILLLFLVIFVSSGNEQELVYFKDPRTNQCFAAQTGKGLPLKYSYIYKITAVDCKNIPDSLIINKLPE